MKHYKKGFTLIELLVVIAIIGILSTLAVVSLGNARQRARDTKRIADIRNIQTALELYYSQNNRYPDAGASAAAAADIAADATPQYSLCTTGTWITTACPAGTLLVSVPLAVQTGDVYTYTRKDTGTTLGTDYSIYFTLEGSAGSVAGNGCASPSGIVDLVSTTLTC